MESCKEIKAWENISKKVYWDREVSLNKWREKISESHRSYFPDAVSTMTAVEFIGFYGVDKFKLDWPTLKAKLPSAQMNKVHMYDVFWSKLVGGGWNLKPSPDFYTMPKKRREFLLQASYAPGKSIYEIAKILDMQYRRAHDHAMKLVVDGKLKAVESVEGGRRKLKLFPAYH